jgi:hypothetical protein
MSGGKAEKEPRRTVMRKRGSLTVILAALLAAPLALGQFKVVADVPFPFVAGGKIHAAGEWSIDRIDTGATPLLRFSNRAAKDAVLLAGNTAYRELREASAAKLIFNRYGEKYFLSEVWPAGTVGTQFPMSREEKALLRAGGVPERTVMFARLR